MSSLPYYAEASYNPDILSLSALKSLLDHENIDFKGLSEDECRKKFKEEIARKYRSNLRSTPPSDPPFNPSATGFTSNNIFCAGSSPSPKPSPTPRSSSSNFGASTSNQTSTSPFAFASSSSSSSSSNSSSSNPSGSRTPPQSEHMGTLQIEHVIKKTLNTPRSPPKATEIPNNSAKTTPTLASASASASTPPPSSPAKLTSQPKPKPRPADEDEDGVESILERATPDYSRYIYFFGLLLGALFLVSQLFSLQMTLVGYCPSKPAGQEVTVGWPLSLAAKYIPCKPCPTGATCENGHAVCKDGLSLSKTGVCKQEQKFQKEKDYLFEKLAQHVAETNGDFICSGGSFGHNELAEDDLRRLSENYVKDPEQRAKLMEAGIRDIVAYRADYDLEFKVRSDEKFFRSKAPKLSFSCRAKLFVAEFWQENYEYISMAIAALVVLLTLIWRIRAVSANRRKILSTQDLIKIKLREQSKMAEPFLAVAHVRQTLMESYPDLTQQDWNEVKKAIKNDPRIQETERDVKGEERLVWEWVASEVLDG